MPRAGRSMRGSARRRSSCGFVASGLVPHLALRSSPLHRAPPTRRGARPDQRAAVRARAQRGRPGRRPGHDRPAEVPGLRVPRGRRRARPPGRRAHPGRRRAPPPRRPGRRHAPGRTGARLFRLLLARRERSAAGACWLRRRRRGAAAALRHGAAARGGRARRRALTHAARPGVLRVHDAAPCSRHGARVAGPARALS